MNRLVKRSLPFFGLLAVAGQAEAVVPEGEWHTAFHDGVVQIARCEMNSVCGIVVAADTNHGTGETVDSRNPDRALRQRPLIGLPVLWGFRPATDGWTGGRLYNPETGQTFRASLRPLSASQLKVTACMGPFCLSQIWTRVYLTRETGINP